MRRKQNRFLLLFQTFLLLSHFSFSQLTVSGNYNPSQLVNQILLGPGVLATNISYSGSSNAIGYFNSVFSNVGLDSGIIMTNGFRNGAIGPNNSSNISGIQNKPGDPDLTAICGQPTKDASVLEFDFVPSSDTVSFKYVFASEEYNEGVCTPFNDVFAFLISGPGIVGQQNIALIPNSNLPVAISSVNGGQIGDPIYLADSSYSYCHLNNTQYYIDNSGLITGRIQYDGLTVVLTAKAVVVPCNTYHIKLAIADGGNDDTWDSAVFLEAGSFNSRYVTVDAKPLLIGAHSDSTIYEGCAEAVIKFTRYDSIQFSRNLSYVLTGTASSGIDYTVNSSSIHFAPGEDTFLLRIRPVFDQLNENIENLRLEILPDFTICQGWDVPGIELSIADQPLLKMEYSIVSTECPYDSASILIYPQGGGSPPYSFQVIGNSVWTNYYQFSLPILSDTLFQISMKDSCANQESIVSVFLDYNCDPYLPNIVTANGDGINDTLVFKDLYKFGNKGIWIYNRFGNLIFCSNGKYENNWSPSGLSDGIYYYVLLSSSGKSFKGFFHLMK